MLLQGVAGPGVQQLVQELADVPPDLLGLGGDVLADDGQEAWAVGVLDDEPQADQAGSGHHLQGGVTRHTQGSLVIPPINNNTVSNS